MNKGIVIAAFATCGKTYLTKKYKNVIDLESSNYKFDNSELINIPKEERKGTVRKINKDWPENYYKAIIKAIGSYDIVLVQLKPEHFDYFDKHNIKYRIAYPNFDEVKRRCLARNNNEKFISRLKEVFKPYYENAIKRNYEKFYILDKNMTLEDSLLEDGIYLEKR